MNDMICVWEFRSVDGKQVTRTVRPAVVDDRRYEHEYQHIIYRGPRSEWAPSYAVEVIADDSGKWVANQRRFATREAADAAAKDLFSRWTAVRETRVVESADPVNE